MRTTLALLLVLLVGCGARVVNEHIVGPHGEDVTELSCAALSGCYELARRTCSGGDFDIVQGGTAVSNGVSSEELMISCRTPP